MVGPC